jgi:hypothetical protein
MTVETLVNKILDDIATSSELGIPTKYPFALSDKTEGSLLERMTPYDKPLRECTGAGVDDDQ